MILSTFMFVGSISAAAAPTDGISFGADDMYYVDSMKDASAPLTIETWVYIPEDITVHVADSGENRVGNLISSYATYSNKPYIHIDVMEDYTTGNFYPRFEWGDVYNNTSSIKTYEFKNATLPRGEWTHIAFVINPENGTLVCYKNGESVQTKTTSAGYVMFHQGAMDERVTDYPIVIGNDNRRGQPYNFRAKLGSLTFFTEMQSGEEIKAHYLNGVDAADGAVLSHWEFKASDIGHNISDKSANGYDLTYSKEWLDPSEVTAPSDYAYSMIVVGDTQMAVEDDVVNGTKFTERMYKWIADNASSLKTQFVVGLGDITDGGTVAEFEYALGAITQLNNVVPYSVVRGNHDNSANYASIFNTDIYLNQFKGDNGGVMTEGSAENTYYKLDTPDGTKWLIVNLDYAPTDSELDWAGSIISSNSDRKAIVVTHQYMNLDGTTVDREDYVPDDGSNSTGSHAWDRLVRKHENIVMVLSGHMENNKIVLTQNKGDNGNTVSQFLIDPQDLDWYYNRNVNDENDTMSPVGLVAILYFDEDGRTVDFRYYSPIKDKYYHTVNQFSFDLEAEGEEYDDGWNGVPVAPSGTGTKEDPYIIDNAGNLLWMSQTIIEGGIKSLDSWRGVDSGYFYGKYFKQVCDIDLNGCAIKSIGYQYQTEDNSKLNIAAFGGNYDGGGYRIYNGRIASAKSHATYQSSNTYAGDGLFGVIYGATIENVTLDNVTVYSQGMTGGIVGRAAAPYAEATEGFNTIRNCKVTNSCKLVAGFYPGATVHNSAAYDDIIYHVSVGGICGMAWATTFEDCVSDVEIEVDGYHFTVGGIAGIAGYNSVFDNCLFNGGITLTDNKSKITSTFGGIVALVTGTGTTGVLWNASRSGYYGSIKIYNSTNNGYFKYTGTEPLQKETIIGGIVGDGHFIGEKSKGTSNVENCVNNFAFTAPATNAELWIGGIVGASSTYNTRQPLEVKNCLSVDVAECGGEGTNEYRYDPTNSTPSNSDSYGPSQGTGVVDKGGNYQLPTLTSFGLSLNDGITVRVQYNVEENWLAANEGAKVVFSNGDEFEAVAGANTYSVTLTPGDIGKALTVTCGDVGLAKTVSVASYTEKVLAAGAEKLGISETKFEQLKTLLAAIVTYGAAADKTLSENISAPSFENVVYPVFNDETDIFGTVSATLGGQASAKLNINTANVKSGYTITVKLGEKTLIDGAALGDYITSKNQLVINGLYAADFDENISITVFDGAEAVASASFTFNAYLKALYGDGSGNAEALNLIAAAYNYGTAAEAFAS